MSYYIILSMWLRQPRRSGKCLGESLIMTAETAICERIMNQACESEARRETVCHLNMIHAEVHLNTSFARFCGSRVRFAQARAP